jgi:hypothetical protein
MADATPSIDTSAKKTLPTLESVSPSGGHLQPTPSTVRAAPDEREAILASLHDERSSLLRAKRAGTLKLHDLDYLAELERYIDDWERALEPPPDDVWTRINRVAGSLLTLQAAVERAKK